MALCRVIAGLVVAMLAPLNSDFDLYTVGPDGITHASLGNSASRDDIVRARDGGFIGTAEEFDP